MLLNALSADLGGRQSHVRVNPIEFLPPHSLRVWDNLGWEITYSRLVDHDLGESVNRCCDESRSVAFQMMWSTGDESGGICGVTEQR